MKFDPKYLDYLNNEDETRKDFPWNAFGHAEESGNRTELYMFIEDDKVREARSFSEGNPGFVLGSHAFAEMLKGKSLSMLTEIAESDLNRLVDTSNTDMELELPNIEFRALQDALIFYAANVLAGNKENEKE